jgi:AraC-like DNA-binding protein
LFAAMMHPGAERLVLFHVIASGRCWVAVPGGDRYWASAGEVIVLPYGDEFSMGGVEAATPVNITSVVPMPPWTEMPVVRYGGGGDRADLVCGCLYSEDPLFDPGRAAFPPALVVRPADGPARSWFDASIAYALEESSGKAPSRRSTKLPELLLTEALRIHLATAPAAERGWLVGYAIPCSDARWPRSTQLRNDDGRLTTLLPRPGCHARGFDARFREVLGRSPIRYLNEWRTHMAQDLLATTDITVAAIARRVGYDAEEAFSRAFKRAHGRSPALWRTARAARSAN